MVSGMGGAEDNRGKPRRIAEKSPAFIRTPEGKGCAKRFIRTLRENLLWVRHFETIAELRDSLLMFRETYNTTWLIERHGFLTPNAASLRRPDGVALISGSRKRALHASE